MNRALVNQRRETHFMDNHSKNVSFAVWSRADRMLSAGADTIIHTESKQCFPYMMRGSREMLGR